MRLAATENKIVPPLASSTVSGLSERNSHDGPGTQLQYSPFQPVPPSAAQQGRISQPSWHLTECMKSRAFWSTIVGYLADVVACSCVVAAMVSESFASSLTLMDEAGLYAVAAPPASALSQAAVMQFSSSSPHRQSTSNPRQSSDLL